jgi:hypothetical protein
MNLCPIRQTFVDGVAMNLLLRDAGRDRRCVPRAA